MKDAVVVSAVRTAQGGFGGALKSVTPTELAQHVMAEVITRIDGEMSWIEKVIFGNCFAPLDVNISRIAAYNAGIPETAPAFSIDATCGSSMQAVISAVQAVQCGEVDVVLAGGVESMSNAPYIMSTARWGQRMRDATASDLLWKGMQEYPIGVGMGLTAENLAEQHGISRKDQDAFALLSHQRATAAIREGKFREDLYYRLKVVTIELPPLRERTEDIVQLTGYFLNVFSRDMSIQNPGITNEAMELLQKA